MRHGLCPTRNRRAERWCSSFRPSMPVMRPPTRFPSTRPSKSKTQDLASPKQLSTLVRPAPSSGAPCCALWNLSLIDLANWVRSLAVGNVLPRLGCLWAGFAVVLENQVHLARVWCCVKSRVDHRHRRAHDRAYAVCSAV